MYNAYASYTIYFEDEAEYNFAQSIFGGQSRQISPLEAATLFDIPYPPPGGPLGSKGFMFLYPYLLGQEILHPGPSGIILDGAIPSFVVPGQTLPNMPPGDTMTLYWSASVIRRGPEYAGGDVLLIAAIPQRRWCIGFETEQGGELHPQSDGVNRCRQGSRVADGLGGKFRSDTNGSSIECNMASSEAPGLPTRASWERFYLRIWNPSTATGTVNNLWYATGTASTSSGARVQLNPSGTLSAHNVNGAGVNDATFGTTPALEAGKWYKVDILVTFATVTLNGTLRLYLDGVLVISGTQGTGSTGLGQIQNHRATNVMVASAANTWEFDFDDWHNAEIPNIGGVETLNSIDWLVGTHVKGFLALTGTSTNWTNVIAMMNGIIQSNGSGFNMVSTTALAQIRATTLAKDYDSENQEGMTINMGAACASFSANITQSGGAPNNGRLGYNIAGGADVLVTQAYGGTPLTNDRSYLPSADSLVPRLIEPTILIYEKGNTADNTTMQAQMAAVQYIGIFGIEDCIPGNPNDLVYRGLMHNCRYPNLAHFVKGPKPDAPVCVIGGTYVGNGTSQVISLSLPCHLLIIRNIASTAAPVVVTTSAMAAQAASLGNSVAADVPMLGLDEITGSAFFIVTGTALRSNQAAQNYQYFAFCDPGLRYLINDEFNHGVSTSIFSNPIIDPSFLANFGLFMAETSTPGGMWLKGPRNINREVSSLSGTLLSDAVEFQLGSINTGADISEQRNATSFSLMRTFDGSALVMIQVTSYTGDGTASRVIPLTPVSGRFPLAAFVSRRTGGSTVYRDTSHAGVNSCTFSSGGNIANGIIGSGVDSITVGTGANVNGAEYSVLVFPGSGSGWLNGTFCGPNGSPPGDFWEPDPEPIPPGANILAEGGLTLGETNPLTLLKDVSGIYTLTPGTHTDQLIDRQTGQPSVDMEIPDPTFKTGYIGG